MANVGQAPQDNPLDRLEGKIDALSGQLKTGLDGVDSRLDRVEMRLDGVEGELRNVTTRLTEVETRLTKIEIVADKTDTFSRNVWGSLTSLDERVSNGFAEAKKEREVGFRLVHGAIREWGERVAHLESPPPPLRRRQR